MSTQTPPSPLRQPPTTGFEVLGNEWCLDEETLPWYKSEDYYPVHIGEVFKDKYQVIGKLGFGAASTVWLCRDLVEHEYVTLKVFANNDDTQLKNEQKAFQHLDTIKTNHQGATLIRTLRDSFELPGEKAPHMCLVHDVLGLTLEHLMLLSLGKKLDPVFLRPLAYYVLLALDYLHCDAKVVHTDIQERNIMMSINDKEILKRFEENEWSKPSKRRIDGNHIIYASRALEVPDKLSDLVVCDFGRVVFGQKKYIHEAMPDLYRAPELVLRTPWDDKIDIWSFGLMCWTLLEGEPLFKENKPNRNDSTAAHIARMIALLGPPPMDLLERGHRSHNFFNGDGEFKEDVEIATTSLEDEMKSLEGEEKTDFLRFLRRILQWRPEDRATAGELVKDPWIRNVLKSNE